MSDKQTSIEISVLRLSDAHDLAPMIAAYGQALKRGAPRQPDQYYASQLLQDRAAEFLGARIDGELVGFIMFYDLPEPVTGMRAGQADHVFVHHGHRGKGIAKALVDVLADQAASRGWTKLMLNAPRQPDTGRKVFEAVAAPADWLSFVLRFDQ
ncbi:MAG: GNAT family N-acetyltransferase [Nitratireductor sp.]